MARQIAICEDVQAMEENMLLRITRYCDLDGQNLMEVYSESNSENTDYFYPDETDKRKAVWMVEAGFMDFLQKDFFEHTGATYWVLEENGVWISALRTCLIQPGTYYLEALETRPSHRAKGYASRLLTDVLETMKKDGSFRLCDCVGKKNFASLKTHKKCGFQIVMEDGYDYLNMTVDRRDYGLEYRYSKE